MMTMSLRTPTCAFARAAPAGPSARVVAGKAPRAAVVVRAEPEETPAAATEQPATPPPAPPAPAGISELMAFAGPAPELINGRLAMLAFVSSVAAELATGMPVAAQFSSEPTLVLVTAVLFAAGTLAPMLSGRGDKTTSSLIMKGKPAPTSFGPFKADAEMLNGRAAMIGFAAMIGIEIAKGSALF